MVYLEKCICLMKMNSALRLIVAILLCSKVGLSVDEYYNLRWVFEWYRKWEWQWPQRYKGSNFNLVGKRGSGNNIGFEERVGRALWVKRELGIAS